MNKTFKIIGRILIIGWICIFILGTCVSIHIRTTYLNKEDLKWTIGYHRSAPSAKFYSDSGNVDKVIFGPIEVDNKSPEIFAITSGTPGFKILEPSVYYSFDIKHYNGKKYKGEFSYHKANGTDSLLFHGSIGVRETSPWHVPIKSVDFAINGMKFTNCFVVDSLNSELIRYYLSYKTDSIHIEKFVFSQDYGLIYYKFDNGEEFYRKFKPNPQINKSPSE